MFSILTIGTVLMVAQIFSSNSQDRYCNVEILNRTLKNLFLVLEAWDLLKEPVILGILIFCVV